MQVVATAGHVDHGKSALVRCLTGQEPDRWQDERERGLTIDLGYVWTRFDDGRAVAFVDVPGHERFIANMLAGVGPAQFVLFVVAADDGWSEQSQEHLEIVDVLGLCGVLVAVTKVDLVASDRVTEVVADVRSRLRGTRLESAPVCPVDARGGSGLQELRTTLDRRLQMLSDSEKSTRVGSDVARLWIDRAFSISGAGTVVTGTLRDGPLRVGDPVVLSPAGLRGRIRGVQCLGRDADRAEPGWRVALNLAGIDRDAAKRGQAVVRVDDRATSPAGTTTLDARLTALPGRRIERRGSWTLHLGTASTVIRVHPLLDDVADGAVGDFRLVLQDPVPVRVDDRLVLRESGRGVTVGGGMVLDPFPGERPRGTDARLRHAEALDVVAAATTPESLVGALVACRAGARSSHELEEALGRWTMPGAVMRRGEDAVEPDSWSRWRRHALEASRDAHEHSMSRSTIEAAALDGGCPPRLASLVVSDLVDDGLLCDHDGLLVHPRNEADYMRERRLRQEAFLTALGENPLRPPRPQSLAVELGLSGREVRELVDGGYVIRCGPLLFTTGAVHRAVELLGELDGIRSAGIVASTARSIWGTNRNAAIHLLEHLRDAGVTRRVGDRHLLVGSSRR